MYRSFLEPLLVAIMKFYILLKYILAKLDSLFVYYSTKSEKLIINSCNMLIKISFLVFTPYYKNNHAVKRGF